MNAKKSNRSFDDYEMEPSPRVWENIKASLPPEAERKRGAAWWLMAAAVAGILFVSLYFFEFDIKLRKPGNSTELSDRHAGPKSSAAPATGQESSLLQQPDKIMADSKKSGATGPASSTGSKVVITPGENQASLTSGTGAERQARSTFVSLNKTTENYSASTSSGLEESSGAYSQQDNAVGKLSGLEFILPVPSGQPPETLQASSGDLEFSHPKRSVSRWQWSAIGSVDYCYRSLQLTGTANSAPAVTPDELDADETGLQTFSTSVTAGYSFSTHFSLVSGLSVFSAGQERNRLQVVLADAASGGTSGMYAVNTSAGVLTGSGQQFDRAYFDNPDSSLLLHTASVYANTTDRSFQLEQQFQFISIPVMIHYQFAERRFTPYAGVGFSAAYRTSERISLNGQKLDYQYEPPVHDFLFSAEAVAGIKYRLSRHFAAGIQPAFRYGLNSLNGNDQVKWIPYSFGIGFGINYRY